MSAVFLATAFVLLTNVWRLHDILLPPALQPVLIALGVGLFVLFFDRGATGVLREAWRQPMARALLGLLLIAALSVPTSLFPGHSLQFLLLSLVPALVGLLLVVVTTRSVRAAERLLGVQIFGCTLFALMALTRFEVGPDGRWLELVFYDSNDLGLLIVSVLPMVVYGLWRGGTLRRLAMFGVAGVLFAALAQTGSRGAFLGLVASLLAMLLFLRVVRPGRRLVLAAAGAVAFLVVAPSTYKESLVSLVRPASDYNWFGSSETGRLELWQRGIGYMVHRPVLGVGLDAFPVAEGRISSIADRQGYGVGIKWSAAHNSFIQAGAELGVVGLLFFAAVLYLAFDSCRRVAIWARGRDPQLAALAQVLAAALAGFVVCGLFLSHAYGAFLFALLGQILGVRLLVERQVRAT